MTMKIPWILISVLMVLSLVVVACGPAATTTTTPTTTTPTTTPTKTTPTQEPTQKEVAAPTAEMPKYGGVLSLSGSEITNTDEAINRTMAASGMVYEELSIWDWTRGPTGTGEIEMTYSGFHRQQYYVGNMAESWEYLPPDRIVLRIRQGVHFALDPKSEASRLVNGREMTAADVAYSLKRNFTEPNAYLRVSYPALAAVIKITVPEPNTVDIKFTSETFMEAYHTILTFTNIVAPEVVQKYGDLTNWKNLVGTGPFMLTDYVPGSLSVYTKNPNYWMKDPMPGPGKGNQLPYIDGIRYPIIPDVSTRQAALRTGKLDQNSSYAVEDWENMMKTAPKLKYNEYLGEGGSGLYMKIYDPKLPFKDVRVRRAMIMAIDYKTIVNDYYKGKAEYFNWPKRYVRDYGNIWVSFEDSPPDVQELYIYNPEKAKQLLKEAGYPNGFKTSMTMTSTQVDYYSIIKDMWSKVGIELTFDIKESAVHTNLLRTFTYPEMITASAGGIGSYYRLLGFSGTDYWNPSQVNEPYIEEVKAKMANIILTTMDWDEIDRLYRELLPKVRSQAYAIPSPTPSNYTLWWPWLKNYSGETNMSFAGGGRWQSFVWLDQALKKSMGY